MYLLALPGRLSGGDRTVGSARLCSALLGSTRLDSARSCVSQARRARHFDIPQLRPAEILITQCVPHFCALRCSAAPIFEALIVKLVATVSSSVGSTHHDRTVGQTYSRTEIWVVETISNRRRYQHPSFLGGFGCAWQRHYACCGPPNNRSSITATLCKHRCKHTDGRFIVTKI